MKNEAWVRNPIDRFVLAKLDAKGSPPPPRPTAGPSPVASRSTSPDSPPSRRRSTPSSPTRPPTLTKSSSTASSPPTAGASTGGGTGSTPPGTPTPTASTSTTTAKSGPTATGSSTPSTRTCPFDQLHGRATRRRPPARTAPSTSRWRLGLQPLQHHDQRGGGDFDEEYLVLYNRDRTETDGSQVWLGLTDRLRRLPRPQVRPDQPEGVLLALRVLQQHDASGDGRQHQGHPADHPRPPN